MFFSLLFLGHLGKHVLGRPASVNGRELELESASHHSVDISPSTRCGLEVFDVIDMVVLQGDVKNVGASLLCGVVGLVLHCSPLLATHSPIIQLRHTSPYQSVGRSSGASGPFWGVRPSSDKLLEHRCCAQIHDHESVEATSTTFRRKCTGDHP